MVRKHKKRLTSEQKEQQSQKKEVRTTLKRMGFHRVMGVEGKHFTYLNGKRSELDDIFILKNVFLIVEYTIGSKYKEHLAKKNLLYQSIFEDPESFVTFLLDDSRFVSLGEYYNDVTKIDYPNLSQLQVRILYCSKTDIDKEYRQSVKKVRFFDLYVSHYFYYLSAALKRSAVREFLDFLDVQPLLFGEQIGVSQVSSDSFDAYVLPEVKSFFKEGYKIVSFYMDPDSLLKRAYVLRHEGWREKSSSIYYQRMADPNRITEIRRYLTKERRVFINNIIVTMSANDVTFFDGNRIIEVGDDGKFKNNDSEFKTKSIKLSIANIPNCIGIIDGQHRVFAYHIGDDAYEDTIATMRKDQNLLVTGVVFPRNEKVEDRRKYEARLFSEINVKQVKIHSHLQQELSRMVEPFSLTSIGKDIVSELTSNGPLCGRLERYSFEKGKVKTASIVSFGLRPLIKIGNEDDSLFSMWNNPSKEKMLTAKDDSNYDLKNDYVAFCSESIRELFIAVKAIIPTDEWRIYSPADKKGLLSITFINGFLNLLRLIIENKKTLYKSDEYSKLLITIGSFPFKSYKTSHYRKMGQDLYDQFFR